MDFDFLFYLLDLKICICNDFDYDKYKIIGVTGTNGKTTVSSIIQDLIGETKSMCKKIKSIRNKHRNKAYRLNIWIILSNSAI